MTETAASTTIKGEMLGVGNALVDSVLGYLVVFIGLTLLMCVIIIVGKIMVAKTKSAASASAPAEKEKEEAAAPAKLRSMILIQGMLQ